MPLIEEHNFLYYVSFPLPLRQIKSKSNQASGHNTNWQKDEDRGVWQTTSWKCMLAMSRLGNSGKLSQFLYQIKSKAKQRGKSEGKETLIEKQKQRKTWDMATKYNVYTMFG